MYFAFAYPHILYGIDMYVNTDITHLNQLSTLNDKMLQILQKKNLILLGNSTLTTIHNPYLS